MLVVESIPSPVQELSTSAPPPQPQQADFLALKEKANGQQLSPRSRFGASGAAPLGVTHNRQPHPRYSPEGH